MGISGIVNTITAGLDGFINDKLQKAAICILSDDCKTEEDTIEVMFNPSQYKISGRNKFAVVQAKDSNEPYIQFGGGAADKFSATLFFDTSAKLTTSVATNKKASDVTKETGKITKLMNIKGSMHGPPPVKFKWGSLNFVGYITSIDTSYTMFDESGKPVRAQMDIVLTSMYLEKNKMFSPFESPDRTKCRIVTEDTNIWEISLKEYGDANLWKIIAKENNLTDPLSIPSGTKLKIPAL